MSDPANPAVSPHWSEALVQLGACGESIEWALDYETPQAAWDACQNASWMVWIMAHLSMDNVSIYVPLFRQCTRWMTLHYCLHLKTGQREVLDVMEKVLGMEIQNAFTDRHYAVKVASAPYMAHARDEEVSHFDNLRLKAHTSAEALAALTVRDIRYAPLFWVEIKKTCFRWWIDENGNEVRSTPEEVESEVASRLRESWPTVPSASELFAIVDARKGGKRNRWT